VGRNWKAGTDGVTTEVRSKKQCAQMLGGRLWNRGVRVYQKKQRIHESKTREKTVSAQFTQKLGG